MTLREIKKDVGEDMRKRCADRIPVGTRSQSVPKEREGIAVWEVEGVRSQ